MTTQRKVAYICGPLTELSCNEQKQIKRLYSRLADVCELISGARAFVPHEHFDPIKHSQYTPAEVDSAERYQIHEHTCILIVVAIAPSWGGGIEVEMANQKSIPVVILRPSGKQVSRLLLGNPTVIYEFSYKSEDHAVELLDNYLRNLLATEFAIVK
jgi:hypothetical protein